MDAALLVARVVLAAVFAVAGAAKLADLVGSHQAMVDFGLPARLARPLGTLLPLCELAVAVLLLPSATGWWGALGALGLLIAFIAGIAVNLSKGRTPDCHCFGALYSGPVGVPTIARNTVLVAVAVFVLVAGWNDVGTSAIAKITRSTGSQWAGLVAGAALLVLLTALARVVGNVSAAHDRLTARVGTLERALEEEGIPLPAEHEEGEGLPVGTPAPDFVATGLQGELVTLDSWHTPGKPLLLVFGNPYCESCNLLWPDLARWHSQYADRLNFGIISETSPEENLPKAKKYGFTNVAVQEGYTIAMPYQATGRPAAVIIGGDRAIATHVATGPPAVRALVEMFLDGKHRPTPTASLLALLWRRFRALDAGPKGTGAPGVSVSQ